MMHDFPEGGELIVVERVEHDPAYIRNRTLPWVMAALMGFAVLFAAAAPYFDFTQARQAALSWAGSTAAPAQGKLAPELRALLNETMAAKPALAAEGEAAAAMNDALPMSNLAIEAARPFIISNGTAPAADRALHCMTQAIYYEAGFEPMEGRYAVAQVILNRMRHPAYPNSVCAVVYQGAERRTGCQFSFTCDGALQRAPEPRSWGVAREIAAQMLGGKVSASVGMATHYHANYVLPYWAPKLAKLTKIGAHIFYRWPGNWGRPVAFTDGYAGREFIPALSSLGGMQVGKEAIESPELIEEEPTGAAALPHDPTDRHAKNDLGGRIDISKGWQLSIPSLSESRSALEKMQISQGAPTQQNGENAP